ncbi:MAG: hypothetical protein ABI621_04785 [Chloroflexota bacterium]
MKHFIGGLFKNREHAVLARKALREDGFDESSLNMLESTHQNEAVVLKENPSIQSIGVGALVGALVIGGLGAVLGLLVGLGVIRIPGLEPTGGQTIPFQITGEFILTSLATGLIFGVVTGAILGVAGRLLMSGYKKVDTSKGINQGDLMLAVEASDIRKETRARLTMKEYGAVRFEEFRDTWDTEIWSVFDEEAPQS